MHPKGFLVTGYFTKIGTNTKTRYSCMVLAGIHISTMDPRKNFGDGDLIIFAFCLKTERLIKIWLDLFPAISLKVSYLVVFI